MRNFVAMLSIVAALAYATNKVMSISWVDSADISPKTALYRLYIGCGSEWDGLYLIRFKWTSLTNGSGWTWDRGYVAPSGPGVWGGFEYGSQGG